MKTEYKKMLRICSGIVFGVYLVLLSYFLFFAESTGRTFPERSYNYNLELFKEIKRFLVHRQTLGFTAVTLNLLGNIVGFVPFGCILPVMHKRFRSLIFMAFLTFEFSLAIELLQLVWKVGSFDVDDLLLNTVGGVIGYLIFAIMDKFRRGRDEKRS